MIFQGCGVAKDSVITTVNGVMPAEKLPNTFLVTDVLTDKRCRLISSRVLSFGAVKLCFQEGGFSVFSPGCEVLFSDGSWRETRSINVGDILQGEGEDLHIVDIKVFPVILAATSLRSLGGFVSLVCESVIIKSTTTEQWEKEKCQY